MEPMTPEGWKVFGCIVFGVGLFFVGLALYAFLEPGVDHALAWYVLGMGLAICGLVAFVWFIIRRLLG